jgi:AcrR family transcriptional regulator
VPVRDSERTRERILETALLAFAERGYHGVNVDDIAQATGISKGGFYFHFPSKQDLFLTLLDEMGAMLVERIRAAAEQGTTVREKLEHALHKGLDMFSRYRGLAKFLLVESTVSGAAFEKHRNEIYVRLEGVLAELLEAAKEAGDIAPDIDTRFIATIWVGAISHRVIRGILEGRTAFTDDFVPLRNALFSLVGWYDSENDTD